MFTKKNEKSKKKNKKKPEVKVKFDCQHCGASFTQKSILKLHVNGVHDKLKPFKCEDCQASFTLEYTLDHHIKASVTSVVEFQGAEMTHSTFVPIISCDDSILLMCL